MAFTMLEIENQTDNDLPLLQTPKKKSNNALNRRWQTGQGGRDNIIQDNMVLINFMVRKMLTKLPASIDRMSIKDDLENSAILGLIDAISKYSPGKKTKFSSYAEWRIKGEMLEFLRNNDWIPRSVRRCASQLRRACDNFEKIHGHEHQDDEELRIFMNLSEVKFKNMIESAAMVSGMTSYDTMPNYNSNHLNTKLRLIDTITDEKISVIDLLIDRQHTNLMETLVSGLTEKFQLVIKKYYYDGLTMKKISELPEIQATESWVCELKSMAIHCLRYALCNLVANHKIVLDHISTGEAKIMMGCEDVTAVYNDIQYSLSSLKKIPLDLMIPWNTDIITRMQKLLNTSRRITVTDLRSLTIKKMRENKLTGREVSFIGKILLKFSWGFVIAPLSKNFNPNDFLVSDESDGWDEQAWQDAFTNNWALKIIPATSSEKMKIWQTSNPAPIISLIQPPFQTVSSLKLCLTNDDVLSALSVNT